jgi:hypothetical protein
MDIFSTQKPGLVVTINAPGGSMGVLTVSGAGGNLTGMGAVVVTAFDIRLAVNNQYAPALDKSVYVYGFGDSIGTLMVSGLTFTRSCSEGSNGLANVLRFYADTRAIRDVQMRMSVSGSTFAGFLDNASIGSDQPEHKLGRFTLSASTLPSMMSF